MIQTGIDWPTITLGEVTYTLRASQGALLYKLSLKGINPKFEKNFSDFAKLVDVFCAFADPAAPPAEAVADLVFAEGKTADLGAAVGQAMGKVFPPSQPVRLQEPVGTEATPN